MKDFFAFLGGGFIILLVIAFQLAGVALSAYLGIWVLDFFGVTNIL